MNHIERATEVITAGLRRGLYSADEAGRDLAQALADAGLLITDEDRADGPGYRVALRPDERGDDHIERAALLIGKVFGVFDATSAGTPKAIDIAKALVNAGWHDGPITEPEDVNIDQEWLDRAVLDAAEAVALSNDPSHICVDYDTCCRDADDRLIRAVRVRKAAQQ